MDVDGRGSIASVDRKKEGKKENGRTSARRGTD